MQVSWVSGIHPILFGISYITLTHVHIICTYILLRPAQKNLTSFESSDKIRWPCFNAPHTTNIADCVLLAENDSMGVHGYVFPQWYHIILHAIITLSCKVARGIGSLWINKNISFAQCFYAIGKKWETKIKNKVFICGACSLLECTRI